jgi:hypothetical protein
MFVPAIGLYHFSCLGAVMRPREHRFGVIDDLPSDYSLRHSMSQGGKCRTVSGGKIGGKAFGDKIKTPCDDQEEDTPATALQEGIQHRRK